MDFKVRHLENKDIPEYLHLTKYIDNETEFLSVDPKDPRPKFMEMVGAVAQKNQLFLVAQHKDGYLVGHLGAFWRRGKGKRVRHCIHIGLGVVKDYWGKGVGTLMFKAMEKWAKEQGVTRLELDVMTNNERGVALYKKMGFEIEGTKRQSICIDGQYIDEYMMSKILED
ncbi:MAG: GNAT family N-acetyltransferase [Aureispira sp.]|nr:GNAT family N-acetyltransferase [Aureispira sp.]